MFLPLLAVLHFSISVRSEEDCSPAGYCICSSSHCSMPLDPPTDCDLRFPYALHYSTSLSGDRLTKTTLRMRKRKTKRINGRRLPASVPSLSMFAMEHQQTIIGFGGGITDAAVLNIESLPVDLQQKLIESYFGPKGIGYSIVRIPIGSCDFSTHEYSYADIEDDFQLESFALAPEDAQKIKWTKRAQQLVESEGHELKTSGNMTGGGELKNRSEYSQVYADYLARFIYEYTKQGVPIWALTVQNQPSYSHDIPFQGMYESPQMEASFIRDNLKPALLASPSSRNVSIMIHDDFRTHLPEYADITLSEPGVEQIVDGIAVHWYLDKGVDPERLSLTKERHPRQFILATEACIIETNEINGKRGPSPGNFTRAMLYAKDIVEDLKHSVAGWMDWNIALDLQGGPNWVKNYADSPIIVDKEKGEFYKQPMFYALGHFSRFIRPGAVVIGQSLHAQPGISAVSVKNVDKTIAVVLLNELEEGFEVEIRDKRRSIDVLVKAQSINTVLYRRRGH